MLDRFDFLLAEGFQWIEKEVNQSVVVNQSITMSWKVNYTAQESSQTHIAIFQRYPQHDSSVVVRLGNAGVFKVNSYGLFRSSNSPLAPRVIVPESASATEPAITIQNVTKRDEAYYQIVVYAGGKVVANHTVFLKVFGNYVHFTCYACIVRTYVCMYVCMYECMCMYVCMYVCVCMYV